MVLVVSFRFLRRESHNSTSLMSWHSLNCLHKTSGWLRANSEDGEYFLKHPTEKIRSSMSQVSIFEATFSALMAKKSRGCFFTHFLFDFPPIVLLSRNLVPRSEPFRHNKHAHFYPATLSQAPNRSERTTERNGSWIQSQMGRERAYMGPLWSAIPDPLRKRPKPRIESRRVKGPKRESYGFRYYSDHSPFSLAPSIKRRKKWKKKGVPLFILPNY